MRGGVDEDVPEDGGKGIMAKFSFDLDIDGFMKSIEDELYEAAQDRLESEEQVMFEKLPGNSQKLLEDILEADNPAQVLQSRFEKCSKREDDELRGILRELREKGYIKTEWGSNVPTYVTINNSARTYHEQLAEYERTHGITHSVAASENSLRSKVIGLVQRGEEVGRIADDIDNVDIVDTPLYKAWMNEINIFNERFLRNHVLYEQIRSTYNLQRFSSSYSDMMGLVYALSRDDDLLDGPTSVISTASKKETNEVSNKVFVVYGHDEAALAITARFLEKCELEAVILREQPDDGLTIIEKIEKNTDVAFAVVLYTECDIGRDKNSGAEQYRARQNVVFEHGYLVAKLGRKSVCPLKKGNVETPGDIAGIVYTLMDDAGAWKMRLAQNMKSAGLAIDFNKVFQ